MERNDAAPQLVREEVARALIGDRPTVRMVMDYRLIDGIRQPSMTAHPWAALAMTAASVQEVHDLATGLIEVLAKEMPAWMGWGIEYGQPVQEAAC